MLGGLRAAERGQYSERPRGTTAASAGTADKRAWLVANAARCGCCTVVPIRRIWIDDAPASHYDRGLESNRETAWQSNMVPNGDSFQAASSNSSSAATLVPSRLIRRSPRRHGSVASSSDLRSMAQYRRFRPYIDLTGRRLMSLALSRPRLLLSVRQTPSRPRNSMRRTTLSLGRGDASMPADASRCRALPSPVVPDLGTLKQTRIAQQI